MKKIQIWINFLLMHGIVFNVIIAPVLVAMKIMLNQDVFSYTEWVYSIGINVFLWQLLSIHIREKEFAKTGNTLSLEMKKNPIAQRLHNSIYTIFGLLTQRIYDFIICSSVFISLAIMILSFIKNNNNLLFIIVEGVVFIQCWRILFIYLEYLSNQRRGLNSKKAYNFWISDLFFKETN